MKNLYSNKIFIPLLIFLAILFNFLLYQMILQPAYASVIGVCQPEKFDDSRWTNAGSTETTFDENGNSETTIWIDPELSPEQNKKILKHEYCHWHQAEIRHFPSQECFKPVEKYLSEFECYFSQNYPDWTYNLIYKIKIEEKEIGN